MVREMVVGAVVCLGVPSVVSCAAEEAPGFCGSLCDRLEECDGRVNPERCDKWCSGVREELWRVRPDALVAIGRCASGRACEEVMSGDFFSACWREAKQEVEPQQRDLDFCEAALPKWFECGDRAGVSTCVDNMKLFSDRALTNARTCAAETSCTVMNQCLKTAFGADE